jgi:signal transduction histidine kinase/CheY-like chemotaxis protein
MNELKRSWISRNSVVIAAAIMSLAVAFNGWIGYRDIEVVVNNFEEARKDGNTRLDLDGVLNDLLIAETGQRGFLLTGDRRLLDPYRRAVREIPVDLQKVDQLTRMEPGQQARLAVLRPLLSQRLAEMQRAIDTYDASGPDVALAQISSGPGEKLMDSILRTAAGMTEEEDRQRGEARNKADASGRRAFRVVIISTTVATLLLLLSFLQFGVAARTERVARAKAESAWEAEARAREDSETANRVKDQFIATVSHELRTPLTSILGWSAVLIAENVESEVIREGLVTIQRSASTQKRLIEDLLDASRILTGKLRLSMRTLKLSDVIHGAVESMRPAADAKSITITTNLDEDIRISGDPDRLQQVAWNLITNAVKFTPRDGTIEVNVRRERSRAIIEVRDSGEGIEESFLPHVFEPFRQADASRARVHKGLGLGLSIGKYLVEAHGGVISVWSAGKGRGSTFRVSLPIMPIVHGEMPDDSPLPAIGDSNEPPIVLPASDVLTDRSVLIVDDHPATLRILEFVLRRSGAQVFPASSAAEAYALLRARRPAIMVSDIGMPDEDGLSLLHRIRALPEESGGRTPAIALTAYVRKEDCDRLLAGGFQAYLTKPIEPIELVNAIRAVSRRALC